MLVEPFSISHDAVDPVCYTIEYKNQKQGIATDMGCYTDEIIEDLASCDSVLLEANHDINLLQDPGDSASGASTYRIGASE